MKYNFVQLSGNVFVMSLVYVDAIMYSEVYCIDMLTSCEHIAVVLHFRDANKKVKKPSI